MTQPGPDQVNNIGSVTWKVGYTPVVSTVRFVVTVVIRVELLKIIGMERLVLQYRVSLATGLDSGIDNAYKYLFVLMIWYLYFKTKYTSIDYKLYIYIIQVISSNTHA